ncbi:MAG: peptidase [Frankiales bacterium]|nr:peptidase [Frankiales bacterium]
MRSPRLALALSVALLGGALAVPSLAAAAPTTTDGCLQSVPEPGSTEPVPICFTIHRPAGASAKAPVPMVLHSHGWAGSRTKDASSFTPWLEQGFGVLSFDQRGFGESGGLAHVENPDLEGQDVTRVVDLVAGLDWVAKQGRRDPVLGAIGGSYGGGYQFAGAFTELRDTGRTRFDALAPEITWWDLKESLAPDDVPRSAWLSVLTAAGARDVPPEVLAGYAAGLATGTWPGTTPGIELDAFFAKNGPKWHVSQGRRLDIPVLFGQGLTDNLFNLNQGLKNFERALTPKARSRSAFVGYNGGHALPNALPAGYGVAGDPCSKALGGGSFADLARRFMAQNLKGAASALKGLGKHHLATADGVCLTLDSVTADTAVALGTVPTSTAVGGPVTHELAVGPITVAGQPTVDALVTALGVDARAFFALSVGTSPADAKVVQNNTMPLSEPLPLVGAKRSFELPAVAVQVPAGQKLFLTVSPVSDMFLAHGSRTPGALLLEQTVVNLPVVQGR